MTDQRGAYTPQQDAPLQFDPRSPAARRPMPMALIASGTLLVMLVAAVAMYYSRGVRGENEPPRPVGEPVAVLKSAPQAGAQPADAGEGDAYAPQNVTAGAAPTFAAAPEAPKPRPAPAAVAAAPQRLTVQTVAPIAIPAPPPAPAARTVAPPTVAAVTAKPVVTAKAAPPPKVVAAQKTTVAKTEATPIPLPAKPAVVVAKAASATSPAKPLAVASASGVRVQIGAFSSAALADKGYADVSSLMGLSIGGKAKHVEPVDKDGHTLYRTSVTGFSDHAAATAFCDALKAKGKICFVKS